MVLGTIEECMVSVIPVVSSAPIRASAASRLALTVAPYTPLATSVVFLIYVFLVHFIRRSSRLFLPSLLLYIPLFLCLPP